MSHTLSDVAVLPTPTVFGAKNIMQVKQDAFPLANAAVVEHRDEVFARVDADLSAWGIQVSRATSANEAIRLHYRRPAELVVAHSDLPDETGWLFACKLRLAWPGARVWVYTPRCTTREQVLADFIGVEEVLAYGGDLQRLSAEVFERLVVASYSIPTRLPVSACAEGE